jgi:hypothetical protein
MLNPEIKDTRKPAYEINPLFLNRWSPRSMTGEELNDDEALFEAARWAHHHIIISHGGLSMQKKFRELE